MRGLKRSAALFCLPMLAGCGASTSHPPYYTGPAGVVHGKFIAAGGPPQAKDDPQQGTVTLTNSATGAVFSVSSGADGSFEMTVPAGIYRATGHTPQFLVNGSEGLCQAQDPVSVGVSKPATVVVVCSRD